MNKISIDFSFNSFSFKNEWVKFIDMNFQYGVIKYEVDFDWFETKNIFDLQHIETNHISIELKDGGKILIQNIKNSLPRLCFLGIAIESYNSIIFFLESKFTAEIVYGRVLESIDNILQESDKIDSWRRKKRSIPNNIDILPNPIYTNEREKEIISIESLPGHSHIMNYGDMLWFGSCWQMYFSSIYYKYIPKFLFDSFIDCYEKKILENGLQKITLFEKVEDFDLPQNRAKQWAFRRALGIDSIAHELTKSMNRIEPKNLSVKITKENSLQGEIRVEIYKKDKIEIKEFLNDGITITYEQTKFL
ncbi:hypothetical protein [Cytophaga aurantiaca]|uniref:hypothetical protein n=1 Tax=Cytophaga aurantiaca TaxID=29530 RepID=UPI000379D6E9|nr:hypothetical protein [Cytophaga aurantiaca]